ncbi:MAG: M14 family zinc carboxypeptidase [Ardenticatenaceae bacterium]|nr:M14 family zinc carboxypeptidase [Ardenticatenaceae bacterium]HBY96057.1 hypothetical protein [Chloroflexota bacterium]
MNDESLIEQVDTNVKLRQFMERYSRSVFPLGTTLGGREVLCAQVGGALEPAVLITAGAHADELGGVYAALRLLQRPQTQRKVYVVPNRDPLGLEGFRRYLQFALGSSLDMRTPQDVVRVLKGQGTLFYEEGTFLISQINDFGFAFDVGHDFRTSSVGRHLTSVLKQHPELVPPLSACVRVIAPYNLPMPRYGDIYNQAARTMIVSAEGFVGNMNRFFDQDDPPLEVAVLRDFVEDQRPGLVLDLHEGYGRGFYVYVPQQRDELTARIARSMGQAVTAHGGQTATPEELLPYWGEQLAVGRVFQGDGMFTFGAESGQSFGGTTQKHSIAFTQETGGLNPVHWRADLHEWAARAAIAAFEAGT